jgi:SP family myo-inositol transporter-like MFS transporter 13
LASRSGNTLTALISLSNTENNVNCTGELFGLEVRGIGTSLGTATNWSANLLIGSTYLSLMAAITPAGAFGFYAGLCFLGWLFCLFCFPETAGLSLEEVQSIFKDGFGIKASAQMRTQKSKLKVREQIKADETSNV